MKESMNEETSIEIEAVIFDWDGTLVDLDRRELYCINKALASVDSPTISMQAFIEGYYSHPYKGAGGRNLIRKILGDVATAEKAIEIYSNEFAKTVHLIRLQEKTLDVLKALRIEGLSLAVATLRRRRVLVEQELRYLEIDRFFDVIVTREDIELKPGMKFSLSNVVESRAQQFMKTLTLLRTEPAKTMIVGDSWWDIRASKEVQAVTAWVKTGFGAYNDFCTEKPDMTLNNVEELLKQIWAR